MSSSVPEARIPVSPFAQSILPAEAEAGARQEALERMEALRSALLHALEVLHAVQALFEIKPNVTRAEFARFVEGALLRSPELHALEWIPRVAAADRASWETTARADGVENFLFQEIDSRGELAPAGPRDEYWPVAYVEPLERNRPVLGLDLRANPCRRRALEQAAATGEPTATIPLRLAQLAQSCLGFLVVLAVREPDASSSATPPRGWVLAVFRVQGLVERIFAPMAARGLRVEVRDLDDEATPAFVMGDESPAGFSPAWRCEQDMPVAGRVWRFTFSPGPAFRADDSIWLRRTAETLQRANELLERRVAERTAELEARGAALERANEELRAEAARRAAAESALAHADAQFALLSDNEAKQWALAGLVGRSARFGQMLREVRAVQTAERTTVLLTGESGTGKELTARAIHYGGARSGAPFVRVNCASLPPEQAEALLFGQSRSGKSGSSEEHRGSCELAEGGTLFLDEIGDLSPVLQARLLRVLEEGAYQPVGGLAPRPLNARVIAATHADLPLLIAAGGFRRDLYYRLLHYHIALPALRERMEDVPMLAQYLVRKLAAELKRTPPRLRPDALQRLLSHSYPGNIRELRNTLERAMLYAGGDEIGGEHIVFAPGATSATESTATPSARQSIAPALAGDLGRMFLSELPLNLSEAEDILIARAIAVAEGNLSQAARLLGINRASIYRWQDRKAQVAG